MRRLYTPELANRSLPLVRAIATDLRTAALGMQAAWKALEHADSTDSLERFAAARRRVKELYQELDALGVEVKDPFRGLLDFRARRGKDIVYLCWCLDEGAVEHWHGLEAGFAGRQPIATFGRFGTKDAPSAAVE